MADCCTTRKRDSVHLTIAIILYCLPHATTAIKAVRGHKFTIRLETIRRQIRYDCTMRIRESQLWSCKVLLLLSAISHKREDHTI